MRVFLPWIAGFFCLAVACKQYQPKAKELSSSKTDGASSSGSLTACPQHFQLVPDAAALIDWTVLTSQSGQSGEGTIHGTQRVKGALDVFDANLGTARGILSFDIASTDTGNPLRNARIKEFILGEKSGFDLRFQLSQVSGDDLGVPQGGQVDLLAKGVARLGGQSADIEIPVRLIESAGVYTLTNRGLFYVNLRAPKKALNAFTLSRELAEFEALEAGLTLKDKLQIGINISLSRVCP